MLSRIWLEVNHKLGRTSPTANDSHPPISAANSGLMQAKDAPKITSAWQLALHRYKQRASPATSQDTSDFFASYDDLHLAIAEQIWENRSELGHRMIHISQDAELVASVSPRSRIVHIRKRFSLDTHLESNRNLQWRMLPARASEFDDSNFKHFKSVPLYALLWHLGQISAEAISLLPPGISSNILRIRRFPYMPPQALRQRHMNLIQLLSQENLTFERLWMKLDANARRYICPDLTSLHMTGCLHW